jgi:hypothetical protein
MTIRRDPMTGALILTLGILTMGAGAFFMGVRPPLLPEDLRYTGVDPAALPPEFLEWLGIVFATWGGFVGGFGLTLVGIGLFLIRGTASWLFWGVGLGTLTANSRFVLSNIILSSDYLWFVSLLFVLSAVIAAALLLRRRGA